METKSDLITPYEGKEAYVFVSYSHRDKDRVFPLLRTMAETGCRIWYDEGIDPGTEWPESIARHLEDSAVCLAFISGNSLLSANCRREINFAVSRNKPFLSVVLEPVKMSPGMEMQISSYQSLLKYKYPNEADFTRRLVSLDLFRSCRTAPADAVPEMREPAPQAEEPKAQAEAAVPAETAPQMGRRSGTRRPAGDPKKGRKKRRGPVILGGIVLLVILTVLLNRPRSVTIGGQTIRDQSSIRLSGTQLTVQDVRSLRRLKSSWLLDVSDCSFAPGAAEELAGLASLSSMSLKDCTGLDSLAFLEDLTAMRELTLRGCGITDGQWASARLPGKLHTLDLGNNALSAPVLPAGLTSLSLENNAVSSLDFLGGLSGLKKLDLSGNGIRSLTGLEGCVKLESLDLGENAVEDLSPLEAMVYLKELDLSGNPFRSAAPLANTSLLQTVDLSFCDNAADLGFLARSADTLTSLNLSHTPLEDIDFLRDCRGLTSLLVQGCGLTDLSVVGGMEKLEVLGAADNGIRSAALSGCVSLRCLDLSRNPLDQELVLPKAPEREEGKTGKHMTLLLADTGFSSRTGLLSLDPDYYYRLLDLSGLPEDAVLPAGLSGRSLILDMNHGQDPAELTGFTYVCVGGRDLSRQVEWESALSSKLRWLSHDEALELCVDQNLRLTLWPWMPEE